MHVAVAPELNYAKFYVSNRPNQTQWMTNQNASDASYLFIVLVFFLFPLIRLPGVHRVLQSRFCDFLASRNVP